MLCLHVPVNITWWIYKNSHYFKIIKNYWILLWAKTYENTEWITTFQLTCILFRPIHWHLTSLWRNNFFSLLFRFSGRVNLFLNVWLFFGCSEEAREDWWEPTYLFLWKENIDAGLELLLIVEEIWKQNCGQGKEPIVLSSRCFTVFVYMLSAAWKSVESIKQDSRTRHSWEQALEKSFENLREEREKISRFHG